MASFTAPRRQAESAIKPRLVVKAFKEAGRHQLDQVVVALQRFAKQNQMIRAAHARLELAAVLPVAGGLLCPVKPAALGHVNFAADNRLDVALARFVEKICGCEEIPVIRDGHRRHFLPRSLIEKFGSLARPVKQTEIGVDVKMYELRLPHEPR